MREVTYAIFLYATIQWTNGNNEGGMMNGLGGDPAQVGFNKGDGLKSVRIPVSGTAGVLNLAFHSNVVGNSPGVYIFKIGSNEGEISAPESEEITLTYIICV